MSRQQSLATGPSGAEKGQCLTGGLRRARFSSKGVKRGRTRLRLLASYSLISSSGRWGPRFWKVLN